MLRDSIKEIICEGCTIEYPYVNAPEKWVGTAKIRVVDSYYDQPEYILVEIPYICYEKFNFMDIDIATKKFVDEVFSPKNLVYNGFKTLGYHLKLKKNNE